MPVRKYSQNLWRAALLTIVLCAKPWQPFAQDTGGSNSRKVPSYDVVSIRLHNPRVDAGIGADTQSGMQVFNQSLADLVSSAYGIHREQIIARVPWMSKDRFDLIAKLTTDPEQLQSVSRSGRRTMLKQILEERFHLRSHPETRIGPIYNMVEDRRGLKVHRLSESDDQPNPAKTGGLSFDNGIWITDGQLFARSATMNTLASALSEYLNRPVINHVTASFPFSIALRWHITGVLENDDAATSSEDAQSPISGSLFSALSETAGVVLSSGRGPREVLLVDSAEKPDLD